jgi:hypothetical protein
MTQQNVLDVFCSYKNIAYKLTEYYWLAVTSDMLLLVKGKGIV